MTKIINGKTVHMPKRKHRFLRQSSRVICHLIKKNNWDSFRVSKLKTGHQELQRWKQKGVPAGGDAEGRDSGSDVERELPSVAVVGGNGSSVNFFLLLMLLMLLLFCCR